MSEDGDYAAHQAYREMDRMPDPSLNPCEHCERDVERLRATVVCFGELLASGIECWTSNAAPRTAWEDVWLVAARAELKGRTSWHDGSGEPLVPR